eukprot:scaffold6442_cov73-Skeletonema_marinoi.AAC.10
MGTNCLHTFLLRLRGACEDMFTRLILNSTRAYILTWILLGVISLLFGAIAGVDTSNPLYTTGQTWLGIAATIGYSYFGLTNRTSEASKDETDQMNKIADQGASDSDGGE